MEAVFQKMQFREAGAVLVTGAPDSFLPVLRNMASVCPLYRDPGGSVKSYGFILAFVQQAERIAVQAKILEPLLEEDGLFWWAYPKKSSRKYRSDITRDHGWQPLGDLGYEAVRQVAIDADWSALRFRKARHIGRLQRDPDRLMSREGRQKKDRD